MEFDWDEANVTHIARHGISPAECEEAYQNGPMVIEVQERKPSAAGFFWGRRSSLDC
jgi:hypothetical protein